uniref:cyclin-dependent kinase n=1 Tax=Denticeps clupeoides TaxID=299321 RepID=A0AAY4AWX6_9TELE
MGDEKETWKVKTLDEILQEKKRRRELEEKTEPKRAKNTDENETIRDTPEEGELRDHRMEITIRNAQYLQEDSTEDRYSTSAFFTDICLIVPLKHLRPKEKEKERESERRKRHWEQDKARRDWERQKRREQARAHSRRERDRLEQIERQRERERKMREQLQKEQREQKERERRAEERRKRETRREVPSPHTAHRVPFVAAHCSPRVMVKSRGHMKVWGVCSPGIIADVLIFLSTVRDEILEDRDLLSDLQDISDSERKTSTGESSIGNYEDEQSEDGYNEERENGSHILEELEEEDDEDDDEEEEGADEGVDEGGETTPLSHTQSATPEEVYIPSSPPHSPVELKKELPKYLPALQGCRSVEEFQCLNRIEEGTYGVVYRAKDKKTDEIVALKRLKMEKEKEGFPITSLREINTILKAQHPNIVTVREIVVGSNMDKIYIVMNYVEHDLKSLMETMKQPFLPGEVKTLMIQLLRGVRHLHDNWILHRDLKTSNLLLSHKGILKIGDFGLAREYGSPLKPYTPVVVTLWYRSPELLLGAKEYSTAVDMWSVGCIFGELLTQKPLFPGKSEIDQINKVFKDLGSPSEKIWPGFSELPAVKKMNFTEYPYNNLRKRFGALLSDQGFDLINKFLTYCPSKRITAEEALKHEYFRETPLPIEPSMFPTWPAKSEQQRVKRGTSPRPPEGGLGYSQLGDDDLKDTGFHLTVANQGASKAGPGFSLKF